jgi:glycolate oxidase iron-sulfur subunit
MHYTPMLQRNRPSANPPDLLQETDRCVKCGLCLPACPTYRLAGDEGESPRGRLALMEALARGALDARGALNTHLDNCLLCRACESACPSGVRFGAAMDLARQLSAPSHSKWLNRIAAVLSRPGLGGLGIAAGRLAPRGVSIRGLPLGRLGRTAAELSARPPAPGVYPAMGRRRGRVGLFLGCIGRHLQGRALSAAVRLLPNLGYEVVVPEGQGCCGAMHLHLGDRAASDRRAAGYREAFTDPGLDAVLSLATGCGIHLEEHAGGGPPHRDIIAFLGERAEPPGLEFAPLRASAALHTPCTQRRMGMTEDRVRRLLAWVPELEVIDLPGNENCCGAAGLHLISHHRLAVQLAEPKRRFLLERRPDWLLSGNPGCLLHLADQTRAAGLPLPVAHPIELLAQQLDIRA